MSSPWTRCAAWRSGNSARQGGHDGNQKFRSTGWFSSRSRSNVPSVEVTTLISGEAPMGVRTVAAVVAVESSPETEPAFDPSSEPPQAMATIALTETTTRAKPRNLRRPRNAVDFSPSTDAVSVPPDPSLHVCLVSMVTTICRFLSSAAGPARGTKRSQLFWGGMHVLVSTPMPPRWVSRITRRSGLTLPTSRTTCDRG